MMTTRQTLKSIMAIAMLLLTSLSSSAIIIRVEKGGDAPYLYTWTGSGSNAVLHTGAYPGTQFTQKSDDGKFWVMEVEGISTVNLIVNMGRDENQQDLPKSNDFLNISGVNGVASFMYDGGTGLFGTIPNANFSANDVYFIAPPSWTGTIYAHVYKDNSSDNEEKAMTMKATDGAGLDVYGVEFNWGSNTINRIEFYDKTANDRYTQRMEYSAGGYYDTSKKVAQFVGTNSMDATFAAAVTEFLNLESGSAFMPENVTYLDVSGKNITSMSGIERFVNLIELHAANNNITTIDLSNSSNLEVLDLSGNSALKGFVSDYSSNKNGHIHLANTGSSLKYLNLSNTSFESFFQLLNTYHQNNLETLIANNLPNMGWASHILDLASTLKHLEWSDAYGSASSKYAVSTIDLSSMTKLEHITLGGNNGTHGSLTTVTLPASAKYVDVSCNKSMGSVNAASATGLEHLDIHGCVLTPSAQFSSSNMNGTRHTALKYLNLGYNNISSAALNIDGFPALETLIVGNTETTGGKAANRFSTLTVNNCPALTTLDMRSLSTVTTATLSNLGWAAQDFTDKIEVESGDLNALRTLTVSGNTLESLDIFKSAPWAAITSLTAQDNAFGSSLTFNAHPTLQTLDVSNNAALTTLDLHGNSALHQAILPTSAEHVELQECNLTNDQSFHGLTALQYVDISDNSATTKTFNLGNNPALVTFKANNANLHSTSTSNDNALTLSGNSALKNLYVNNNPTLYAIPTIAQAPNLEHFEFNNSDVYLNNMSAIENGANFQKLEYLDFSLDAISSQPTFSNFPELHTLILGNGETEATGNNRFSALTITNCPKLATLDLKYLKCNTAGLATLTVTGGAALTNLDITGNTLLTTLNLTNNGLSAVNFLTGAATCTGVTELNLSDNAFTAVPAVAFPNATVLRLNSNELTDIDMTNAPNIDFLYARDNNFAAAYTLGNTGNLVGIDLGANGFTSFTAVNKGATLTALSLGNNTSLTTLNLHGNEGLTRTSATETMSNGSGVYLLGCSALEAIDIADSYFDHIGQDHSLQGLTAVTTLKANNNRFVTFTNSNYSIPATKFGDARDKAIVSGKPSLEELTELRELDLRNNLLADSVHLWRNTKLERLDISGNQQLGPLATTDAEKAAMRRDKAYQIVKAGDHYNNASGANTKKTPGVAVTITDGILAHNVNPYNGMPFELRDCDLRDTVGVYHLDLNFNRELKYLNVSRTAIRNTAAAYSYMVPGWESDGTHAHARSTKHSFMWMQPATKLKVIHADWNNMQSNGFMYYTELDTLTEAGMYGNCRYMGKEINMSSRTRKWVGETFELKDGILKSTPIYVGRDGNTYQEGVNAFDPPIKYWDVRESYYDSIGTNTGVYLERLIANGNPIKTLNISHNPAIIEAHAVDCTSATVVNAHDLNYLSTLDLSASPGNTMTVKHIFAGNDPALPVIDNLNGLANLELLYLYNDQLMGSSGNIDVTANTNLKTLWVSNCDLPELDLNYNTVLDTLRCYDNLPLNELSVSTCANMRHLDLARCSVELLDLANNSALHYLDCSNSASAGHNFIVDLDFTAATDIATVHADRNDLHAIKGLFGKTSLATLSFAHNHVNAIDLSGCTALTAAGVDATDNGRAITAECASAKPEVSASEKIYFFQLDSSSPDATGATETFIGTKTSLTSASHSVIARQTRELNSDGLDVSKITAWTGNAEHFVPSNGSGAPRRVLPNSGALDPSQVLGDIVLLDDSNPQATYTYDSQNPAVGDVEFYLDWTAPDVVTAITDVTAQGDVASVRYYNPAGQVSDKPYDGVNIVVTSYTDGTQKTTKVVF